MITRFLPKAAVSATNKKTDFQSKHKTIKRSIVYAGANDMYKEQYCLQEDFKELFCTLNKLGIQLYQWSPARGYFVFS